MSFENKVILLTGGTSGIGKTTIKAYLKHGANKIITCGRTLIKWDQTIAELILEFGESVKEKVKFIQTDIRIESEVAELIKSVYDIYGAVDIVVNNAGVNIKPMNIWEEKFGNTRKKDNKIEFSFEKDKEDPIFTNLYGTIFCLKWELKYIIERENKDKIINIINIVSSFIESGVEQYTIYAASKSGLSSLVKSVAGQVSTNKQNKPLSPSIHINSINPGNILTPLLLENLSPILPPQEQIKSLAQNVPLGRLGRPEEVSRAILFLSLSKNTSYIQGTSINVDGGLTEVGKYIS